MCSSKLSGGIFLKDKFELLLSLKKYRYIHFNYEFIYEAQIEQIEGTANFVELYSLREIDNELYLNKLNEMIDTLQKQNNLLPVRIISYDSGALLLHILKENNIIYKEQGYAFFFYHNGNVIETGSHEELLNKKGFYANLYNSQVEKF